MKRILTHNRFYSRLTSSILLSIILFFMPSLLPAPEPPGFVEGIVTNAATGLPVVGATVIIDNLYSDVTESTGYYIIVVPTGGVYPIDASHSAYQSYLDSVTVIADTVVTKDFSMTPTCWDSDQDGYGDPGDPSCPNGSAADCDDSDPLEYPGQTWYLDADGDGHSDGTTITGPCTRQANYYAASELTATSGDCNDSDGTVYPGATELCDGQDNDCDSSTYVTGLIDNGDGTITDADRGLMYYDFSALPGDCASADSWAGGLSHAGYSDWRLPSSLNSDGSGPCSGGYCPDSELGHLHNIEGINPLGGVYGPFKNLMNYIYYTTPAGWIYAFHNSGNEQHQHGCPDPGNYAIAVRDVPPVSLEVDQDGDNYVMCTIDAGGWDGDPSILGGGDCNESDGNINPGATEVLYTGIDEDCNPATVDHSWTISTAISGVVTESSMAIDGQGNLHIAYQKSEHLMYTTNASGSWSAPVIVDDGTNNTLSPPECVTGVTGAGVSIAVDSSDKVHISYSEYIDDPITHNCMPHYHRWYATNATGSWVLSEYGGNNSPQTEIAVDSSGSPHMLYVMSGTLRYSGGEIFSDGSSGFSIAIDLNDKTHISYKSISNGLIYATNHGVTPGAGSCSAGSDFDCITVDDDINTGYFSSIAVDNSSKVHISYHDSGSDKLKYATNWGVAPGTGICYNTNFNCDSVDTNMHVGTYSSIALDASENVHISYYDSSNTALKYVTNTSGSWINETVDSPGVGLYTSLALDSDGYAHITYSGSVKYATNAPDADGDGYSSNDCNDSDADTFPGAAPSDSATACMKDTDGDDYGDTAPPPGVTPGTDCNDGDINNWTSCGTCVDGDTDTHFINCDAYTTINGPDCNDGDINNWTSCGTCVDGDTDTHFINCDAYTTINGPDCNDGDINNWTSCGTCVDGDTDTHFINCDAYTTINGPDCNDSDADEHPGQTWYLDGDGDGYSDGTTDTVSCTRPLNYYTAAELLDISGDCNDGNIVIYPGAAEVCDTFINDCNDQTASDGEAEAWYGQPTTCGVGGCFSGGVLDCTGGAQVDTCTPGTPAVEGPPGSIPCKDMIDNDCDGALDFLDSGCFEPEPEVYEFEESWPPLQQPWYFNAPMDVAVDREGAIYVADTLNDLIHKFTADRELITRWGSTGTGEGQFYNPTGVAVDSSGFVYVVDSGNYRIQKFDGVGTFIRMWGWGVATGANIFETCTSGCQAGIAGPGDGQFNGPAGIAVDRSGFVYVTDVFNYRVQKFDSDGVHLLNIGSGMGSGDGQFNGLAGIAVDSSGLIYVVDEGNYRIQKFDSDGVHLLNIGNGQGSGDGQFDPPRGIAIDRSDFIYVVDEGNNRVQKFDGTGSFVRMWGWGVETGSNAFEICTGGCQAGIAGSGEGQLNTPKGIAADGDGYIYVSDGDNNRIQKFSEDGQSVSKLGSQGDAEGDVSDPYSVTIDSNDPQNIVVYMADRANHRIQKFDSDGTFIEMWGWGVSTGADVFEICTSGCRSGIAGTGDGQFNLPGGITVDGSNPLNIVVYVVDQGNYRIQKFTQAGGFITAWGSQGSGNGQFQDPRNIAADSSGFVYVTDYGNDRVQKFASDGSYVSQWTVSAPRGIAVDSGDPANILVYVTDDINDHIQKFTSYGEFVMEWGGPGSGDGQFIDPAGIEVDGSGFVYVVDTGNHRVQKFTPDGQFLSSWGTFGSGAGDLNMPEDVAVTDNGNVFVADTNNHRIQVTRNGAVGSNNKAIIVAGGGAYEGNGILDATYKSANFAYRALNYQGFGKDRIFYMSSDTDFDLDENFVFDDVDVDLSIDGLRDAICGTACGGTGPGWAMDANNLVLYLIDHGSFNMFRVSRTEMLSASTLDAWLDTFQNAPCPQEGLLSTSFSAGIQPTGWTVVDNAGFGAEWRFDAPNNRGNLTGGTGFFAVANSDYEGFVDMDTELRTPVLDASNLAIVNLEFKTDFLYYALGGAEVADVDVSINGAAGPWTNVWRRTGADYRGPATESIDITSIAAGESNVMVRFRYYNANYDFWWQVDDVKISGDLDQCHMVTLIYEACESGSFLSTLTPPAGRNRIVISSASPDEEAKLALQGTLSFSEFFWTDIFRGFSVKTAFDNAAYALTLTPNFEQTPLLDDTGNGIGNEDFGQPGEIEAGDDGYLSLNTFIGNGTVIAGDVPLIGGVSVDPSPVNNQSFADIIASGVTVTDSANSIARVWAVVLSQDSVPGVSDNPVSDLPHIELLPSAATADEYRATYNEFTSDGIYDVIVFAEDIKGKTTVFDRIPVTVGNPPRRRAILVASGTIPDPTDDQLWPAVDKNISLAYNALRDQGYSDSDIHILSPINIPGNRVSDGNPTPGNLRDAICGSVCGGTGPGWAMDNSYDLILYMIGDGDSNQFYINQTERVWADSEILNNDLDTWLDTLQNATSARVTVIYDASYSGSYNAHLIPPAGKERILIGSSGGEAYFISDGDVSFSKFFWVRVLNGWNIRDAYLHARRAMEFSTNYYQRAVIDDNGNGVGNEAHDGELSVDYTIGMGMVLAGKDPLIGSVSILPDPYLHGTLSASIHADNVTTVGTLAATDPVWAVVTHPKGPDELSITQTIVQMTDVGGGSYEGTTPAIFNYGGRYEVTVYAKDDEGNISSVAMATVHQLGLADKYEEDDISDDAHDINVNAVAQQHNFDTEGDVDWVQFSSIVDTLYTIRAANPGSYSDVVIDLFHESEMGTPVLHVDDFGPGIAEERFATLNLAGKYYVRVTNLDTTPSVDDRGYDLSISIESGECFSGAVEGLVMEAGTGFLLPDVTVSIGAVTDQSDADTGYYFIPVSMSSCIESHDINATLGSYNDYTDAVEVISGEDPTWKIIHLHSLSSCNDNDGDGYGNPGDAACSNGSATDCDGRPSGADGIAGNADDGVNIHPNATEVCDDRDNNCDMNIDEGMATSPWYRDADGDNYGDGTIWQDKCNQPAGGWVADNTDCDDNDVYIYPGGPEVRIVNPPTSYYWINELQTAYSDALDGETIQCKAATYTGDLSINEEKAVTIQGGYDCGYSTVTGVTTIQGNMAITHGTSTIQYLEIQ